jgi:hypothetical protein
MREAITQPNPKTHSHAKYCTYWGKTFAQMGTFYPRVTIVFLFFFRLEPEFLWKKYAK